MSVMPKRLVRRPCHNNSMLKLTTSTANPSLEPFASVPEWLRINLWLPWLVLAAALAITWQFWKFEQMNTAQVLQTEFNAQVREIVDNVNQRMRIYEQVLQGIDGLLDRDNHLGRNEFHDYVARLRLEENYPGIQAVGYTQIVPAAQKDQHIAAIRNEGFPDYGIHPEGKRKIYTPVIYIEPFSARNQSILGNDMYSDLAQPGADGPYPGVRRAAMELARDTGRATISGKVRLAAEAGADKSELSVFLMYLPVYRQGVAHSTVAERRANIIGWVWAPFRINNLLADILGAQGKNFEAVIYDDKDISGKMLGYDTGHAGYEGTWHAMFKAFKHISVSGHPWTVAIRSLPAFEGRLSGDKSKFIVVAGAVISLMLALLTWLLLHGRSFAIQEARRLNKELVRSERSLRSLFDNAGEGIWVLDTGNRTLKVNHALAEMLGCSTNMLAGKSIYEFLDEENAEIFRENILKSRDSGNSQNFEITLRRGDGKNIFCQFGVSPIRDEHGSRSGTFALVADITARKLAEEARSQLSGILERSLNEIYLFDPETLLFEYVNYSAQRNLGFKMDALRTMTPLDIKPELDEPSFRSIISPLLRHEKERIVFETLHRRANGTTYPAEIHLQLISSPGKKSLGKQSFLAVILDITERKQNEEALRQDEEKFRAIFEGSQDAIMLLTENGFFDCNARTLEIFDLNFKQDFILCHPADFSPPIQPDGRDSLSASKEKIDFALRHGSSHFEWVHRRKNGEDFPAEVLLSAFDYGGERVLQATVRDITERKRREALLTNLFTAIEQSPVSVSIANAEGSIQYVNPQFTAVTGYAAVDVIGQNMRILHMAHTPPDAYLDLWEKISSGTVWYGESLNRRRNGETYWEETHIAPVADAAGKLTHYVYLKTDISERIKTKTAIERVSALYKMLSDMNATHIHARDRGDLFQAACRIAMESGLFQMAWVGLLEPESGAVIPAAYAGHVDDYLDKLDINIHHPERGGGLSGLVIRDGVHVVSSDIAGDPRLLPWREHALRLGYRASAAFPLRQSGRVVGVFNLYAGDVGLLSEDVIKLLDGLAEDISFTLDFIASSRQREQVQNELQELSMFLQSSLEQERKRIAREMHDELGQTMTALHFDLKWLHENIREREHDIHNKLSSMQRLVGQTVDAIRRISEDLRPGMLDDLGLAAAIEHHVAKFSAQTGIACDLFMSQADFELDDQVATALFRIVQESLTNVARHSGATHVSIRLQELQEQILLIVQDNGRGLPPQQDSGKKTYGLLGMRERVKMLQGTLDMFNEAGAGARIEVCVPKFVNIQNRDA